MNSVKQRANKSNKMPGNSNVLSIENAFESHVNKIFKLIKKISSVRMSERRLLFKKLIDEYEFIINIFSSYEDIKLFEKIFAKIIKGQEKSNIGSSESIYKSLLSISPDGCELLQIDENVTSLSLKKSYKDAVKQYHPDIHGENEEIYVINNAYDLFYKFIKARAGNYSKNTNSNISIFGIFIFINISSVHKFIYSAIVDLFAMYVDLYDVENASIVYNKIRDNIIFSSNDFEHEYGLYNKLCMFAKIIHKTGNNVYFMDICKSIRYVLKKNIIKCTSNLGDEFEQYMNKFRRSEFLLQYINVKKAIKSAGHRLIIKNPIQAENAYKYRIIDKELITKLRIRFNTIQRDTDVNSNKIQHYADNTKFINLSYDKFDFESKHFADQTPSLKTNNFLKLLKSQKNEYTCAFYINPNYDRVYKYRMVRLESILNSIVRLEQFDIFDSIKNEISFLSDTMMDKNFNEYKSKLLTFVFYVSKLSDSDLISRMSALVEASCCNLSLCGNDNHFFLFDSNDLNISLSSNFIYFAQLPVSILLSINSKEKLKQRIFLPDKIKKEKDSVIIYKFLDSQKSTSEHISLNQNKEDDAQTIISFQENICKNMLTLSDEICCPELIGLPRRINDLTSAYCTLKNFKKAYEWLDLCLRLPWDFFERTSKDEIFTLQKRYLRCCNELTIA